MVFLYIVVLVLGFLLVLVKAIILIVQYWNDCGGFRDG